MDLTNYYSLLIFMQRYKILNFYLLYKGIISIKGDCKTDVYDQLVLKLNYCVNFDFVVGSI